MSAVVHLRGWHVTAMCLGIAEVLPGQQRPGERLPAGTAVEAVIRQGICPVRMRAGDTVGVVFYPIDPAGTGGHPPSVFLIGVARLSGHTVETGPTPLRLLVSTKGGKVLRDVGALAVHPDPRPSTAEADTSRRDLRCDGDALRLRGRLDTPVLVPALSRAARKTPARPRDFTPPTMDDERHYVPLRVAMSGARIHPSVLVIHFEESTPRAARAAVVNLFDGRVIGGKPAAPGADGDYFVQVPRDRTGQRILEQGNTLSRLPGVAAAYALPMVPAEHMIRTPRE